MARMYPSLQNGNAAVGDDALPGDERGGVGGEEHRDAADIARLAESPQRRRLDALVTPLLVLPQRAGELGPDQPGSYRVDADVLRPPFGREIAHQLMIGGLGDAVSADHGVGEQPADRADDDEAAAAALRHAGKGHAG